MNAFKRTTSSQVPVDHQFIIDMENKRIRAAAKDVINRKLNSCQALVEKLKYSTNNPDIRLLGSKTSLVNVLPKKSGGLSYVTNLIYYDMACDEFKKLMSDVNNSNNRVKILTKHTIKDNTEVTVLEIVLSQNKRRVEYIIS